MGDELDICMKFFNVFFLYNSILVFKQKVLYHDVK